MSVSFDGFDLGSYLFGVLTPILLLLVIGITSNIVSAVKKNRTYRR